MNLISLFPFLNSTLHFRRSTRPTLVFHSLPAVPFERKNAEYLQNDKDFSEGAIVTMKKARLLALAKRQRAFLMVRRNKLSLHNSVYKSLDEFHDSPNISQHSKPDRSTYFTPFCQCLSNQHDQNVAHNMVVKMEVNRLLRRWWFISSTRKVCGK